MSEKHHQLANNLLKTEQDLNNYTFQSIPIGGLFSEYLFKYYLNNEPRKHWQNFFAPFRGALKAINNYYRSPLLPQKTNIIITKLNDKEHINRLVDPLIAEYSKSARVISTFPEKSTGNILFNHAPSLSLSKTVNVFFYCVRYFIYIRKAFKRNGLEIVSTSLFLIFFMQIMRLYSWILFLQKESPKMIVFDYDRHTHTCPIALASKKHHIKTVTLVHGVINPPIGYTPVLADQIWCWGTIQANLLIQMNVNTSRIEITGNPIAQVYDSPSENELNELRHHLNIKPHERIIGLVINPIGDSYNFQQIDLVLDAIKNSQQDIKVILKTHPSQLTDLYRKYISDKTNIYLFDNHYENRLFIKICDFLVLHNSGMAYESICNNVGVGVLNNIAAPLGNGHILIDQIGCPAFTNPYELSEFLNSYFTSSTTQKDLLEKQLAGMYKYYYKTGTESSRYMIEKINSVLTGVK